MRAFLAKQIACPGTRFSGCAPSDGAPGRADGHGRPRAADRLRQRGEPADGPRHRAASRRWPSASAWARAAGGWSASCWSRAWCCRCWAPSPARASPPGPATCCCARCRSSAAAPRVQRRARPARRPLHARGRPRDQRRSSALAPALQLTRRRGRRHAEGRGRGGRGRRPAAALRRGLVVAQVALSLLLAASARASSRAACRTCARSTPASRRTAWSPFAVDSGALRLRRGRRAGVRGARAGGAARAARRQERGAAAPAA